MTRISFFVPKLGGGGEKMYTAFASFLINDSPALLCELSSGASSNCNIHVTTMAFDPTWSSVCALVIHFGYTIARQAAHFP